MAVIIGNATVVTTSVADAGITSVDWSRGGQPNKQWALGSTSPYSRTIPSQSSVSFSVYGGESSSINLGSNQGACVDSPAKFTITITPAICTKQGAGGGGAFSETVYVASYSYTKDYQTMGTETWQGNAYLLSDQEDLARKVYAEPLPDYVALGTAEGTLTGDDDATTLASIVGVVLDPTDIVIEGFKGNVQASQLSVGAYETTHFGTVTEIGGSIGWEPGVKASANVTLNIQPIYVGT
jgi:hypothetical protein